MSEHEHVMRKLNDIEMLLVLLVENQTSTPAKPAEQTPPVGNDNSGLPTDGTPAAGASQAVNENVGPATDTVGQATHDANGQPATGDQATHDASGNPVAPVGDPNAGVTNDGTAPPSQDANGMTLSPDVNAAGNTGIVPPALATHDANGNPATGDQATHDANGQPVNPPTVDPNAGQPV